MREKSGNCVLVAMCVDLEGTVSCSCVIVWCNRWLKALSVTACVYPQFHTDKCVYASNVLCMYVNVDSHTQYHFHLV